VPFISIPTTAGTGSEVTKNAVFRSKIHNLNIPDEEIPGLAKTSLGTSMSSNPVQFTQEEREKYLGQYLM